MNKSEKRTWRIIALAYFHRYGWIAVMLVCLAIWPEKMMHILAVSSLVFSVWSFFGYKKKWKHIYCSYQNACHQKMTPNHIQWHKVKKSDAYGVPFIFFLFSLALFAVLIWY